MSDHRTRIRDTIAGLLGQVELQALLVDPNGRIRYASPRLEAMLGCSPSSLNSVPFDTVFSPRNPDWISREARRSAAAGWWSGDAVLRKHDKTECWAHIQACRLPPEGCSEPDLLFIFEDNTEHVEMVSALMRRTEELYDRNWELEVVNRIGRLLASDIDLEGRLYALLRESVRSVRADGGLILIKDHETGCLVVRVSCGERPDCSLVGCVLPLDEAPLAAETMKSRQPLAIKDTATAPCINSALARVSGAKSVLSVPMCIGRKALGVLMLGTRQSREFARQEITLVEVIANQAAFAIDNAQRDDNATSAGGPSNDHRAT